MEKPGCSYGAGEEHVSLTVDNKPKLLDMSVEELLSYINDEKPKGCCKKQKKDLKVYEALYKMATRDMEGAASLFLEAISTFGSYDLDSHDKLILYTVITSIFALDRPNLRSKVIESKEIQDRLNSGGENDNLIPIKNYLDAFYKCRNGQAFVNLAELENQTLKPDHYLSAHCAFYVQAMRLKSYTQYLMPNKSISIEDMSNDFGLDRNLLRAEIQPFIQSGELKCRFDADKGIIEINHLDNTATTGRRRFSIQEHFGKKVNVKYWISNSGYVAAMALGSAGLFEDSSIKRYISCGISIFFVALMVIFNGILYFCKCE